MGAAAGHHQVASRDHIGEAREAARSFFPNERVFRRWAQRPDPALQLPRLPLEIHKD
jgi:hypothetical protein